MTPFFLSVIARQQTNARVIISSGMAMQIEGNTLAIVMHSNKLCTVLTIAGKLHSFNICANKSRLYSLALCLKKKNMYCFVSMVLRCQCTRLPPMPLVTPF